MAVVFDAVAEISGTAVTSLTTPAFTITSSANRAGILGLSHSINSSTAFSGSIGGTTGSLISGTDSGTAKAPRTLIFGVTAPPSGSQTATMSWTTAANGVLGVVTASGVDQATSFNNGTFTSGTTTTSSVSVTSTSGDLTVDTVVQVEVGFSAPLQTQRWNLDSGAGSTGPGTGSATHGWTLSSHVPVWTNSGANFVQGAGAIPTRSLIAMRVPSVMVA